MTRKNLKRYYQAWELRQQGKKLREIAQIMGFKSRENARRMINYIDLKIKYKKPMSNDLIWLIKRYKNNRMIRPTRSWVGFNDNIW